MWSHPRVPTAAVFLLAALGMGIARPLSAQIRLQVAISAEDPDGIVEAAVRSEFLKLGDVDLVAPSVSHDYALAVSVLCTSERPSGACEQYAIGVHQRRPLAVGDVLSLVSQERFWDLRPEGEAMAEAAAVLGYVRDLGTAVMIWGRNRVREGAQELVARIYLDCLRSMRLPKRILEARERGDEAEAERLYAQYLRTEYNPCGIPVVR